MSRGCDRWHIWPVVTKTQPAGVEDRKADKLSLREDLRALYKQGGEGAGMIEINYPLSIRSDFGYCAHVALPRYALVVC